MQKSAKAYIFINLLLMNLFLLNFHVLIKEILTITSGIVLVRDILFHFYDLWLSILTFHIENSIINLENE